MKKQASIFFDSLTLIPYNKITERIPKGDSFVNYDNEPGLRAEICNYIADIPGPKIVHSISKEELNFEMKDLNDSLFKSSDFFSVFEDGEDSSGPTFEIRPDAWKFNFSKDGNSAIVVTLGMYKDDLNTPLAYFQLYFLNTEKYQEFVKNKKELKKKLAEGEDVKADLKRLESQKVAPISCLFKSNTFENSVNKLLEIILNDLVSKNNDYNNVDVNSTLSKFSVRDYL